MTEQGRTGGVEFLKRPEATVLDARPNREIITTPELLRLELRKLEDAANAPRWESSFPFIISTVTLVVATFRSADQNDSEWAIGYGVAAGFFGCFFLYTTFQAIKTRCIRGIRAEELVENLMRRPNGHERDDTAKRGWKDWLRSATHFACPSSAPCK